MLVTEVSSIGAQAKQLWRLADAVCCASFCKPDTITRLNDRSNERCACYPRLFWGGLKEPDHFAIFLPQQSRPASTCE